VLSPQRVSSLSSHRSQRRGLLRGLSDVAPSLSIAHGALHPLTLRKSLLESVSLCTPPESAPSQAALVSPKASELAQLEEQISSFYSTSNAFERTPVSILALKMC